jgi:hypothetical protein
VRAVALCALLGDTAWRALLAYVVKLLHSFHKRSSVVRDYFWSKQADVSMCAARFTDNGTILRDSWVSAADAVLPHHAG